jgi:hypothetical protein
VGARHGESRLGQPAFHVRAEDDDEFQERSSARGLPVLVTTLHCPAR